MLIYMIKKRLLVITTLVLIGIFSISISAQVGITGKPVATGEFSIAAQPPNQPTNFSIQDGPDATSNDNDMEIGDWDYGQAGHDSTPGINDTHNATTFIRWKVSDQNGDTVTTRVCISTPPDFNTCDIHNSLSPARTAVQYNQFIIIGINRTLGGSLSYASTLVNKTYNFNLTPIDSVAGTALLGEFKLVNSLPREPYDLNAVDYWTVHVKDETHNQTPTLYFNVSDPDNGTNTEDTVPPIAIGIDHWPADLLTPHVNVSDIEEGRGELVFDPRLVPVLASGTATAVLYGELLPNGNWTAPIPWGTIESPVGQVRNPVYVRLWADDGLNGTANSSITQIYNNTNITLVDYLPEVLPVNVTNISFTGLTVRDVRSSATASCNGTATIGGQTCQVSPYTAKWFNGNDGFTGIVTNVSFTDYDGDCLERVHSVTLWLCEIDFASGTTCTSIVVADKFNYSLKFSLNSGNGTLPGNACKYNITVQDAVPGGPEFFMPTGLYKLKVDVNSQSGVNRSIDDNSTLRWFYSTSQAISYYNTSNLTADTSQVFLGPSSGATTTNQFNAGDARYIAINHGNTNTFADWATTDFCRSDLGVLLGFCNGTDFVGYVNDAVWNIHERDLDSPDGNNFQIDDDNQVNITYGGSETPERDLNPLLINVNITTAIGSNAFGRFPSAFERPSGLTVCTNLVCNGATTNVSTYYHIAPQSPLTPGTYNSQITLRVSAS